MRSKKKVRVGVAVGIGVVTVLAIAGAFAVRGEIVRRHREQFVSPDEEGHLRLEGRRYRFVGVNVYSLASGSRDHAGFVCGPDWTDAQVVALLEEVAAMGCNVVRFDAYQSFTDGGRDYDRIDLIIDTARRLGMRVVMTLENQWQNCTEGGVKTAAWYRDGYLFPYGAYRLSYRTYVQRIVARYRDEPTVLMWQMMNEGRVAAIDGADDLTVSVDDPEAFYAFVRDIAVLIRSIDPYHVVSIGTTGITAPSSGGIYYGLLHAMDDVDIVEAHDYHHERDPLPVDIRTAAMLAHWLRKPFFVGEVGMRSPPFDRRERAQLMRYKLEAMWADDIDGIIVWSYRAGDGRGNDFDADDPLATTMRIFTDETLGTPHGSPGADAAPSH